MQYGIQARYSSDSIFDATTELRFHENFLNGTDHNKFDTILRDEKNVLSLFSFLKEDLKGFWESSCVDKSGKEIHQIVYANECINL